MKPQIDHLRRRISSTLAGFSAGQKAVTAIAIVALAIGGFTFSNWASRPTYAPLFSNLSSSDASAITQKLSGQKIPYELSDGGQTILVPQSKVYQTRIDLSAAGLPSGGSQGYSLLDKQGITTSDFTQHVDYQRALEGELTKTIEAINGVQSARVHLVVPSQDIFATGTSKPSASVLIQSAPGQQITSGMGQAIVHLVATSVEGLDPSNVTVADTQGHILSAAGAAGAGVVDDTQSTRTHTFETSLSASLTGMLDRVLGPNHAVVQVAADLDYDQRQTTTESFPVAPKAPTVSETTTNETYSGGSASQAAGAPTTGAAAPGAAGSSYNKNDASRTYAVPKVTDQVVQAPGTVRRLSVAVALDANAKNADKATVAQLVSAAAGIAPARGDSVSVDVLPFDTAAATQAAKDLKASASSNSTAGMMSTAKTAGLFLVIMVALFLLVRASKRQAVRMPLALPAHLAELEPAHAAARAEYPTPELVGAGVGAGIGSGRGADGAAGIGAGSDGSAASGPPAELTSIIDRQPDEVAQLLRGWLGDRRELER